uniref:Uncharacterized protein n=1 Tax=Triticum urartu TaxID=4572 RepID=A0A8R7P741_TRIUA
PPPLPAAAHDGISSPPSTSGVLLPSGLSRASRGIPTRVGINPRRCLPVIRRGRGSTRGDACEDAMFNRIPPVADVRRLIFPVTVAPSCSHSCTSPPGLVQSLLYMRHCLMLRFNAPLASREIWRRPRLGTPKTCACVSLMPLRHCRLLGDMKEV